MATHKIQYPHIILLAIVCLLFSCKKEHQVTAEKALPVDKEAALSKTLESQKGGQEADIIYVADSLLKVDKSILVAYQEKYRADTCGYAVYGKEKLKKEFAGIKEIGDVNGDGRKDTVFLANPFNYCEQGLSYYFFDASIPRIYTDTYCVGVERFFTVPDIDEDGANEVAFYASSCASRYKWISVYSLQNGEWTEIASVLFDILTQDPEKTNFESLVKKTGKGTFKVCEFSEGKTTWLAFSMK
ncbi:hypothetical protein [Flavobacterium akiainvivens]|nr:hypothetical protein [Flavobacterium akiainvivens]SFQ17585.1 hypothetical protein SAMN05444144_101436 [Flavobacterium akiainvivens]